jgi:hypothetical protein
MADIVEKTCNGVDDCLLSVLIGFMKRAKIVSVVPIKSQHKSQQSSLSFIDRKKSAKHQSRQPQ